MAFGEAYASAKNIAISVGGTPTRLLQEDPARVYSQFSNAADPATNPNDVVFLHLGSPAGCALDQGIVLFPGDDLELNEICSFYGNVYAIALNPGTPVSIISRQNRDF